MQMDERTSASSVADARGNDRQARGTCPKMPLACTGTMQKAPRITVQKANEERATEPLGYLQILPVSAPVLSIVQLAPRTGGCTRDRTRVNPWRGRRARPCRHLVPVVVTL